MTLFQLETITENFATEVALETRERSLTFTEVNEIVNLLAMELYEVGIRPGDTVGLSVKNEINHFLLTLALLALGTAHIVLASHDPVSLRARLKDRLRITRVIDDKDASGLLKKMDKSKKGNRRKTVDSEFGSLILKTSGTVSNSKLVPIPFASLLLQANQHPFYTNSRFLRLASVEHNNSKRHRLYCFFSGGTNLFRSSEVDALDFEYLKSSSCTRFDIARSHFASLLETSRSRHLPADIAITIAGSPLPSIMRMKFQEEVSPNLTVRYGSTETGTIALAFPADHQVDGCVGKPLPGVEIEVSGSDNGGAVGMLRLRTPGMASSYLDSNEHQQATFQGGWFIPGDLGEVMDSGMLRLNGRNTDAFTLDGVNVFPRDSEATMLKNTAVRDVAVVKRESANHDGIPVAFVVLNPGQEFDELGMLMWARNEMGLASPRQIIALSELPISDQGKIDFQKLKEIANE